MCNRINRFAGTHTHSELFIIVALVCADTREMCVKVDVAPPASAAWCFMMTIAAREKKRISRTIRFGGFGRVRNVHTRIRASGLGVGLARIYRRPQRISTFTDQPADCSSSGAYCTIRARHGRRFGRRHTSKTPAAAGTRLRTANGVIPTGIRGRTEFAGSWRSERKVAQATPGSMNDSANR